MSADKPDVDALVWSLRQIVEYVYEGAAGATHVNAPFSPTSRVVVAADALESLEAENKRLRRRAEHAEDDNRRYCRHLYACNEQRDVAISALKAARSLLADLGQQDTRDWPVFQQICAALATAEGHKP